MKVRSNISNDQSQFEQEFKSRINKLRKYIDKNIKEIKNFSDSHFVGNMDIVTDHFNANLAELTQLEELSESSTDEKNIKMVNQLSRMFRESQNQYLDMRVSVLDSKIKQEENLIEDSGRKIQDKISDMTGNILFSVIAVVLGLSLVSSMIEAIKNINPRFYLVFYVTITWIATVVMGIAYLMLRGYNEKSKSVLIVVSLVTLVLILVFLFSFFFCI